jgi:antitoxin component of RelBE/YafQ-DinJ toxin-antitoxin module
MPPRKKIEGKVTTIAVKIGVEKYRQSTAIAALKGETVSEIVRARIDDYIKENQFLIVPPPISDDSDDPLDTGKPNAETLETFREIEEGGGVRYSSTEELFKDLGI